MRHASIALAAALVAATAACDANPAFPEHEEGPLSVELTYTPDHVHLLQTEVTFRVEVRDAHGEPVTDFEVVQVERLADGSDTWRAVELQPAGDAWEGTHVFASSGEYRLRATGRRHGETETAVLHELHEPMHVARAHAEAGPYRVEFECFPGHVHEGETGTLKFWIMEPERDAQGNRPPITGVGAQVHVAPEGAEGTLYEAHEHEGGVYEAEHVFDEAGAWHGGLHFTAPDGHAAEADFELHVSHGH